MRSVVEALLSATDSCGHYAIVATARHVRSRVYALKR